MNETELVSKLRAQILQSCYYPFYARKFREAGVDPLDIHSLQDFQRLPFLTREEVAESFSKAPPRGELYHPDTVWITHTPSPGIGLLPEYHTREDWAFSCRVFADHWRGAGITPSDIVQNANQFNLVVGANLIQYTAVEMGAKIIGIGAGESERQIRVMNERGSTVLVSQPSFIMKLGAAGAADSSLRVILAGGEPFTAIEGYKEQMKSLYGTDVTICDMYGISGFNIVAQECRFERGMHVFDDYAFMEIIDPETEAVLPDGERGEIVLTHLNKTAMPYIRFRTGDLSVKKNVDCPCGKSISLPQGVFGRTTEMHRVKGLKFYPSQAAFVLAGFKGISARDYTVVITRPAGKTDQVELQIKGSSKGVDMEYLKERLRQRLLFTVDRITIRDDVPDGINIEDLRGGIDR